MDNRSSDSQPGGSDSIPEAAATVSQSKEFLEKLAKCDGRLFLLNRENIEDTRSYREYPAYLNRQFKSFEKLKRETSMEPPKAINLLYSGEVAHVEYFIMSKAKTEYSKGRNTFGRFFFTSTQEPSGELDVVFKTWDLEASNMDVIGKHPARLSIEISLLMDERLKSHVYLPDLVGYSIDKKLAVFYSLKPKGPLGRIMDQAETGWNLRLKIAIQIATLLHDIHTKMGIVVGSIDPMNILLDKEDNIKLCAFGLTAREEELTFDSPDLVSSIIHHAGGSYCIDAPELRLQKAKFTTKTDIFAFGALLLDLLHKIEVNVLQWRCQVDSGKAGEWRNESFSDDPDEVDKVTRLVRDCVDDDPDKRPVAEIVLQRLQEIESGRANKKHKDGA